MTYSMRAKRAVLGLCISYSMCAYSMDNELRDPVEDRRSSTYWLFDTQSFSRYCPRWLRGNNTSIRLPAPTEPAPVAMVSSSYTNKQIALITTLVIGAAFLGYSIANACERCVDVGTGVQQDCSEAHKEFQQCLALLENCSNSLDSVKDLILEHCTK